MGARPCAPRSFTVGYKCSTFVSVLSIATRRTLMPGTQRCSFVDKK